MAAQPDETAIIARILDGEVNAYEELMRRHESYVTRIVAAHVPDENVPEVVHEAFIRAYRSLAGYSPTAPFKNWLTTIALRSCHDFWRTIYRRKEAPVSTISDDGQRFIETALATESREEFERMARQTEARQVLNLVLGRLKPLDRMIITLTYLEERTVRETAEMLGISVPNAKVRAFRAKRKLKNFLKRHGIQGGEA